MASCWTSESKVLRSGRIRSKSKHASKSFEDALVLRRDHNTSKKREAVEIGMLKKMSPLVANPSSFPVQRQTQDGTIPRRTISKRCANAIDASFDRWKLPDQNERVRSSPILVLLRFPNALALAYPTTPWASNGRIETRDVVRLACASFLVFRIRDRASSLVDPRRDVSDRRKREHARKEHELSKDEPQSRRARAPDENRRRKNGIRFAFREPDSVDSRPPLPPSLVEKNGARGRVRALASLCVVITCG